MLEISVQGRLRLSWEIKMSWGFYFKILFRFTFTLFKVLRSAAWKVTFNDRSIISLKLKNDVLGILEIKGNIYSKQYVRVYRKTLSRFQKTIVLMFEDSAWPDNLILWGKISANMFVVSLIFTALKCFKK